MVRSVGLRLCLSPGRGAARDFGPHENNLYRAPNTSSLGASLGPPPSWAPRIRLLYPPFSAPLSPGAGLF